MYRCMYIEYSSIYSISNYSNQLMHACMFRKQTTKHLPPRKIAPMKYCVVVSRYEESQAVINHESMKAWKKNML